MITSIPMDPRRVKQLNLPVFDGFPYLVTRIVPAMYHIILLPRDAHPERLQELARRQATVNRLQTFLVLNHGQGTCYGPDGRASPSGDIPTGGILVSGTLQPCEVFSETEDLRRRRAALRALLEATSREGYLMGDLTKGGRPATPEEARRLAGTQANGVPNGLTRCAACAGWKGECLDPSPRFWGKVMRVHCPCDNWNRCARCGQTLHTHRLNANCYAESDGQIWHVPGFAGLSHRCSDR